MNGYQIKPVENGCGGYIYLNGALVAIYAGEDNQGYTFHDFNAWKSKDADIPVYLSEHGFRYLHEFVSGDLYEFAKAHGIERLECAEWAYTRGSFMRLAEEAWKEHHNRLGGSIGEFAYDLFTFVDWQSPEAAYPDWESDLEWRNSLHE